MVLSSGLRRVLERGVLDGRGVVEGGVRAALVSLGVSEERRPGHLDGVQAGLRNGLRAKCRQLGGDPGSDVEVLVWDAAYEQWHRLLFARFLAENGLLRHPEFGVSVSLAECEELAEGLGEPDGWSVAARFASEILPGIFRLDDPCVRLRLAGEHRSELEGIVAGLPVEVFTADDSLGWVYQYWQSERKDAVNASEVKIGGADLSPVTQLFTENYMVRFLLENSLGAWWAARRPDSPLLATFEFLRFAEDGTPAAGSFASWPERIADVTVMDPCCGSGHFLVEAFGMLWRMRAEEEGLDPVDAQDAVLADNLFGLELDPRCVQIAMFAVALQAWKDGGGWRELPSPNIACSGIPAKAPLEEWTSLAKGDERLERALERLHTLFKDADTLGSLIDPRRTAEGDGSQASLDDVDFDEVAPLLERAAARETDDPTAAVLGADAAGIARAAQLLARTYTLITTNPPYLARGKFADTLLQFDSGQIKTRHKDLYAWFVSRWHLTTNSKCAAFAIPGDWQFLKSFSSFRADIAARKDSALVVRLGMNAFRTPLRVNAGLLLLFTTDNQSQSHVELVDVSQPTKSQHSAELRGLLVSKSATFSADKSHELVVSSGNVASMLSSVASAYQGIATGDYPRFGRCFWELPLLDGERWIPHQSTVQKTVFFGGRSQALMWEAGTGTLSQASGARVQGLQAWGRTGVIVSQIGSFAATIYSGGSWDNNCSPVIPRDSADVNALWAFISSDEYARELRAIDQSLKVTNATLVKVPFDVERWRAVAAVEFPDGLPEPWSDDPTQWLFEGRPEVASEPLQVAVGRLVGFRWPEQAESDDLDGLVDGDGIVCLPAVGGEQPAADRVMGVLAAAFGERFSPGLVRDLLERAGSSKSSLGEWLRDEFFKHHCKVFEQRPFVWHVWDGRKDGFAALVNYHRLDRGGLGKLTYTYLGDWIERQRADVEAGVGGADVRLGAALELKGKLEKILEGEPPFDIFVRWKSLAEQPVGWDPDLDDGVRLNIRPFVEAGVLRSKVNVHWKKDRGKEPDGSERLNDLHYSLAEKHAAQQKAS